MKDTQAFKAGSSEVLVEKSDHTQLPPSAEEAEARLHHEGYECFHWYDVPGANYPQHKHNYDECLWLLKGELLITLHEKSIHLKQGDKIYLPAQTPHDLTIPHHSSATYLVGQKKSKTKPQPR